MAGPIRRVRKGKKVAESQRKKRYNGQGKPTDVLPYMTLTQIKQKLDEFKLICTIDPVTNCWLMPTSRCNSDGYHQFKRGKKNIMLHRAALVYRQTKEVEHTASHLCSRSNCFNPDHLFDEDIRKNNSRKGCVGRVVCTTHGQVADTCKHAPKCIKPPFTDVTCCYDHPDTGDPSSSHAASSIPLRLSSPPPPSRSPSPAPSLRSSSGSPPHRRQRIRQTTFHGRSASGEEMVVTRSYVAGDPSAQIAGQPDLPPFVYIIEPDTEPSDTSSDTEMSASTSTSDVAFVVRDEETQWAEADFEEEDDEDVPASEMDSDSDGSLGSEDSWLTDDG